MISTAQTDEDHRFEFHFRCHPLFFVALIVLVRHCQIMISQFRTTVVFRL